jgi:hypothetical protein
MYLITVPSFYIAGRDNWSSTSFSLLSETNQVKDFITVSDGITQISQPENAGIDTGAFFHFNGSNDVVCFLFEPKNINQLNRIQRFFSQFENRKEERLIKEKLLPAKHLERSFEAGITL